MIQVMFKGLDKSELAKTAAIERIGSVVEKFPDLHASRIHVTLEMQNSPHKAGPDFFSVKMQIFGGRFNNLGMKKSATNLYQALAEVVEHMLEKLNRWGDRQRVKNRSRARRLVSQLP